MSQFDDDFNTAAMPDLFATFADESGNVAYTPKNSTPVDLVAIIGVEKVHDEDSDAGLVSIARRCVTICTDPESVYGGIEAPNMNAIVTVLGVDYAVERIETVTELYKDLHLKRIMPRELSRSDYRKPMKG